MEKWQQLLIMQEGEYPTYVGSTAGPFVKKI